MACSTPARSGLRLRSKGCDAIGATTGSVRVIPRCFANNHGWRYYWPTPMGRDKRQTIDIINNSVGGLSVLPCAYFWGCGTLSELFHVGCKGSPGLALMGMFAAVPLSAVAGTFGWRAWYLATAASAGTLLWFIITHFVD